MGRDCLKLLALASMAGFLAGCAPDVPATRYSLQVCGQEHRSEVRDPWWGSLYVAQLGGDNELVIGVYVMHVPVADVDGLIAVAQDVGRVVEAVYSAA